MAFFSFRAESPADVIAFESGCAQANITTSLAMSTGAVMSIVEKLDEK
jgi:hypothetical protein